MRALTVQQPWAWAIVHGGKDIENRTQAWTYRGPLAIHAGQRWSERGGEHPGYRAALAAAPARVRHRVDVAGALLGVVDLVDVHPARMLDEESGCCDPWGEQAYTEHGGRVRREIVHLVLENARALDRPIPCLGRLGLWTPPAEVLDELRQAA